MSGEEFFGPRDAEREIEGTAMLEEYIGTHHKIAKLN